MHILLTFLYILFGIKPKVKMSKLFQHVKTSKRNEDYDTQSNSYVYK